jgi:hypothetical protein
MKTISVTPFVILALLLSGATAQAQERLRPGNYELTTNGSPVGSYCFSPAAAKAINGAVQGESAGSAEGCKVNKKVAGNTISITTVCSVDKTLSTSVQVSTYHGDSFETEIVKKYSGNGHLPEVHARTQGRRTGDCR